MRKALLLLAILAGAFVAIASQTPAQAQLLHTWVASNGSDSANCDRPTPCATFSIAGSKTNAGGEITCVDSGTYGNMTIGKSLTINCEAAIGSNTLAGGATLSGFIIVGLAATDVVTLRGLDFDGANVSTSGSLVFFNSAGTLRLEKMKVSNLHGTSNGVLFQATGTAKLHVTDSTIANIGTGSGINGGIIIRPNSGVQATVMIERTVVDDNQFGIFADGTLGGTIRGTVTDSIVSGNINNGISVNTNGANVGLMVENTKVSGNNIGLAAGGTNGFMLVRHSTITANNIGLSAGGGGSLVTYKDNALNNNSTDGVFSFPRPTQ